MEGEVPLDSYSTDRLFVVLRLEKDAVLFDPLRKKLQAAGHPIVEIILNESYELGGEFFLWEFATAVAAIVMKINPFDEPNVKESKDNTVRVIEGFKKTGALPQQKLLAENAELLLYAEAVYADRLSAASSDHSLAGILRAHLNQCASGDYVALLAYLDQNQQTTRLLQKIRGTIGASTKCATTLGFGPRYLHSTGQLHKGGPPKGVFLLVTADESVDSRIPGEPFTFEVLKQAQAIGDYQSLASRSLRIVRIHLGKEIEVGLNHLQLIAG